MAEPKLTCDICGCNLAPNDARVIFIGFKQSETNHSLMNLPGEKFRTCGSCRQDVLGFINLGRWFHGQLKTYNCETDGAVEDEQTAEAAVEEHEEEQ